MAYRCLQDFLKKLEEKGELHRIDVEVDPMFEIAEITDRVSKAADGGKALLFERVMGSQFPVATNLFGSYRRLCLALEINDLADLTRIMEETWSGQFFSGLSPGFEARQARQGLCQEIIATNVDLADYPILKSWPEDGGKFITLPLVFTRDPDNGLQNCGMYRVRIFDGQTAGIHWSTQSGGAIHAERYRQLNEPMPVAIVLGGDPAIIWSATLPLPLRVDEMAFAGHLRREPVEMVRCLSSDLLVPANSEMVIEGFIEPYQVRDEGAFGNHTGYYTEGATVPVLRVSCITHRRGMIYPATIVGPPPMEDCYLAKAAERLLLPVIRHDVPAVVDINLPMEGIFHGCAIVAMQKDHAGQPQQVMEDLWRSGWLEKAKLLVVVDADIDVTEISRVTWKTFNNADWSRDVFMNDGKMGIDATAKIIGDPGNTRLPIRKDPAVVSMVEQKWRDYGWK